MSDAGVGAAAFRYSESLQWSVIPVRADKRPAVAWAPYQDRRPTMEELLEWFGNGSEPVGVAVVTGAISNVVVVDIDGDEGERTIAGLKVPRTVTAITGKGRHLYFAHPGNPVGNGVRILPGVDLRGDGGFAVAPPSQHPSGKTYRWAPSCSPFDVAPAPLPGWATVRKPDRVSTGDETEIPAGRRNDALTSMAGVLRRKGASQEAIRAALLAENAGRCVPPLEEDEVRRIAESVSRYRPHERVQVNEEAFGRPSGLRLARMSEIRARRVDWLIQEAVPIGNTTLVAGPAGLAKTTLLCDWAARISRGQMPGAFHGRPRDVVLMSGEDSIASTLKPRCEAAGADPARVHFVEFGDEEFAIPGDLDRMASVLATVPEAVFFGIDPLMAFVEDRIDSHKDHHIRRAFSALKRFAEDAGLAVVVIAHLNKSESRDFLSRVAGSVGIGAAVRCGFAVVERPDSNPDERERLLVHVKANLGPYQPTHRFRVEARTALTHEGEDLPTSGLAWLGVDESVTRANVLADPEERTERDEASDWLRDFLADGPREAEDVLRAARSAGFAERTLRRAKSEIRVRSEGPRDERGRVTRWGWSLPSSPDGQHKGLTGGNLDDRDESAGQSGPGNAPGGPDGHMATRGHVEESPNPVAADEVAVEPDREDVDALLRSWSFPRVTIGRVTVGPGEKAWAAFLDRTRVPLTVIYEELERLEATE